MNLEEMAKYVEDFEAIKILVFGKFHQKKGLFLKRRDLKKIEKYMRQYENTKVLIARFRNLVK